MSVTTDRWSCPREGCHRTVVIDGSPADVHAAIVRVQERHRDEHRKASEVLARIRDGAA